jgi:hypothetical protein
MWVSGEKSLSDLDANTDRSIGTLSFIDVCFCDVNIKRMEMSLKGRKVERVSIMNCRGKIDEALSVIFECVLVECLKLDCLNIKPSTSKVIEEGVATCSSLKCLVFQATCMTKSFAESLQRALARTRSLESLYLSALSTGNSESSDWINAILEGLRSNRSLKHLGLARVRDLAAADVLRAIQSHEMLESISFACLDGIASNTLMALDEVACSAESRMRFVKLSVRGDWTGLHRLPNRPPGDGRPRIRYKLTISTSTQYSDMHILGEMLIRNSDIHSLSLAHCGLGEEDVACLATYLECSQGLKSLSLLGNALNSGRGCEGILKALRHNQSLERIDFPTIIEQKVPIDHLLDCNRAGRRFLKEVNGPVSLWPVIMARAGTIDYTTSYPIFTRPDELSARRANAIYHLLHEQAHRC